MDCFKESDRTVRSGMGQGGLSLINLVLSIAIICVIVVVVMGLVKKSMTGPGGKQNTVEETKAMAADTTCREIIDSISKMSTLYYNEKGSYPSSVSDLFEVNPSLSQQVEDSQLWVENGTPALESGSDGVVVTGYCTSGKKYEYTTASGVVKASDY